MGRRARALFDRAYDKEIAIKRWREFLLPNVSTDIRKIGAAGSKSTVSSE
jgi:hypothetical protein